MQAAIQDLQLSVPKYFEVLNFSILVYYGRSTDVTNRDTRSLTDDASTIMNNYFNVTVIKLSITRSVRRASAAS